MGANRQGMWMAAGAIVVALGAGLASASSESPGDAPQVRSTPPAHAKNVVRLATYNVLNLFDAYDDPSLSGSYNDDCYSYDKTVRAKPDNELEALAKSIRTLDADVIGLEEIESRDALAAFNAKYLQGMGYDYVMSIDVLHERGIEQAVLSRFPIKQAMVWPHMDLEGVHPDHVGNYKIRQAGRDIAFSRSPLFVRIEVPAHTCEGQDSPYELGLFVVHHKSGGSYGYWRDQEAQGVLRKIRELQAADPNINIAVLGDFNAEPEADSIHAYLSAGMRDMVTPPGDHDGYYTHETRRAIDYILMNPAMAADAQDAMGFVFKTPIRAEGEDYRTTPSPEGFASDHLPVVIDFVPIDR